MDMVAAGIGTIFAAAERTTCCKFGGKPLMILPKVALSMNNESVATVLVAA
eukprot:CAMPEP_0183595822 /NCGR_PEP_ID=MMETSP0371-20130417/174065_1 /TAXON_ID=268820 /ORGANISM="Peridinium aciculiferum, Strain PAER-2" /LENGTH=50 /DNA_ID=CAMNT_0025807639 /DNA_START=89 /DNA_END=237 /DNA_ORIENTATION=+